MYGVYLQIRMKQNRLPEIVLGVGILVALASIVGALWLANPRFLFAPPPTVGIQLGDDWQAIQAHSTYPFRNLENSTTGYATTLEPIQYRYTAAAHPLELENVNTVYFQIENARVVQIHLTRVGGVAEWDASVNQATALIESVERAGWVQDTPHETTQEILQRARDYYDNPTFKNMMNDYWLKQWRTENARMEIGLYRNRSAGDVVAGRALPNDLYSVMLRIVADD